MRKIKFQTGEYYHVYNRGIDKREIFSDEEGFMKFLRCMREFNDSSTFEERMFLQNSPVPKELSSLAKLVEINAYCLNHNHYHFILKQLEDDGIKTFMHKIGTGYTNYFNTKNERSGSLFQGPFKAVHIDANDYLLYLSAYVNANHFIHAYDEDQKSQRSLAPLEAWQYSSLPDYAGKRKGTLCNTKMILDQFSNTDEYLNFVKENALQMREKKELKKYLFEEK